MRRLYELPRADQIEVLKTLRDYLGAQAARPTRLDKEIERREQTLEAMRKVAEHMKLTDSAPRVEDFDEHAAELGIGFKAAMVVRGAGVMASSPDCP
jgi:hypothetical protein